MDNKFLNKLSTFLLYFSILAFTIAFNFSDNRSGGWYQQFLPDLNGASMSDFTFTDSTVGYSVTNVGSNNSYILKTTNSGDNWEIKLIHNRAFDRIEFINDNIGFTNAFTTIYKTTNAGENWNAISLPGIFGDDMFVLNEDTIWLAMSEGLTGGVYKTTNGGTSWVRQLNLGTLNPDHIYMYNKDIGFICRQGSYVRKTTDGGQSWIIVVNNEAFTDIYFTDSLTGWRAAGPGRFMKKTTDGGLNWTMQNPPSGNNIYVTPIFKFSNVNKDTIWGAGGVMLLGINNFRGIIYHTTNGGNNWGYQLPDTSILIGQYNFVNFVSKLNGWTYSSTTGVHTITGGDTTFYTSIKQLNTFVPNTFSLDQNYPNPFNPITKIKFTMSKNGNVAISIYNLIGKQIETIVKSFLNPGEYETEFKAGQYSSGTYFYSMTVDGKLIDTKKMILIK